MSLLGNQANKRCGWLMQKYVKTNNKFVADELQKIGLKFYKKVNSFYYFVRNNSIIIPAPLNVLSGDDIE